MKSIPEISLKMEGYIQRLYQLQQHIQFMRLLKQEYREEVELTEIAEEHFYNNRNILRRAFR